jgi:hypothetical protein
VLSTTTLGTLTKADNGVAEVVPVNDLGVPTLPFGTDTITVSLENASGATVASQAQQFNCLALA